VKLRIGLPAAIVLATAISCSSRGVVGLNPLCREPHQPTRVSCNQAVLVAQAVALSHHVATEGPRAEVNPGAVAKGVCPGVVGYVPLGRYSIPRQVAPTSREATR
jgi:hypothetical protein